MIERSLVQAAARLRDHHEPHLIATVVCTRGSAYRRPGARMILTQFSWIAGSVSGGCLEGDIARKAWWHTRHGDAVVVTYDSQVSADADDADARAAFGLGCGGVVDVMLERAGAPGRIDSLALAYECWRTQRRAAVATVFRSERPDVRVGARLAIRGGGEAFGDLCADAIASHAIAALVRAAIESGESDVHELPGLAVFVEALVPPPRLFVFGAELDALPLVQLARAIGWDVAVCTSTPRVTTRQRFAGADELVTGTPVELAARVDTSDRAVAVVMAHDYERDRDHLAALLAGRARYIGVLGARHRTQRMLDELGVDVDADPRLHAPVGLELGAETPAEIALAVVAEIQAVLQRAPGESLREHAGPIHERTEPGRPERAA